MKRIIFTKTIICIFILLLMQTQVLANPIPVFYAFGALDEDNIKSNSQFFIDECEMPTNRTLKRYYLFGSYIDECEKSTNRTLKRYYIYGSYIDECEKSTNRTLKRYYLFGSTIDEREMPTNHTLKRYQKF